MDRSAVMLLHRLSGTVPTLTTAGCCPSAADAGKECTNPRGAEANPSAHEPSLASALNNLGIQLSALGQREALAASQEAVKVFQRLAAADPTAYEPKLALALWGSGWVRVAMRTELDEALRAVEVSIGIFQRLMTVLPDAFGRYLKAAYRTAADVLDLLGRAEEASNIRRQLGDEDEPGSGAPSFG